MLTQEPPVVAPAVQVLNVTKEVLISAPIDIVWETVLEPQGPMKDMAMKLEAWVGGRWYRDLGNNMGHLWGHVQVIKPPKLLELVGPMMMSYPVASHVQYRLTEEAGGTKLALRHQALGLITAEHLSGVNEGWGKMVAEIQKEAEGKAKR